MIEAYYYWCHSIGLHLYDIPALIVLVLMIIIGLVHWRNQRKRQKDFEEEMEEKQEEALKIAQALDQEPEGEPEVVAEVTQAEEAH